MSGIDPAMVRLAAEIAGGLLLGVAAGAAHLLTLRASVRLFAGGRVGLPILLQFVRLAVLGLVLYAVVRVAGAPGLLAAAAGILAVRAVMLRRERADG